MIISNCHRIVGGIAEGFALVTNQPINFLAMVDPNSGRITAPEHELAGISVKDRVLVFPHSVGSSVGAYSIYSLKQNGNAPIAMVCLKADITTASGCAIASIPVIDLPKGTLLSTIEQDSLIVIDASTEPARVKI
jgi:uncharacterized protein